MIKSMERPNGKSYVANGIRQWLLKCGVYILVLAAALFISSSRLDWTMGWAYLCMFAATHALNSLILIRRSPELIAERVQRADTKEGAKAYDRVLSRLMGVYGPLGVWIVAGLDVRFGWSPQIPLALQITALGIAALGCLIFSWAMVSNEFFSTVVRIQTERSHTVIIGGPYQYVRHPGYIGWIILLLATPLTLGSLWALIIASSTMCIVVVRTALEDRVLQHELDGYTGYAKRVRYRLLPYIW